MKIINLAEKQFKLYCDLDGVMADFQGRVESYGHGMFTRGKDKKKDSLLWSIVGAKGVGFWSGLDFLEEGKELWAEIKKHRPIILTALPRNGSIAIQGKKEWVKNHLGPNVEVVTCMRVEKKNYAGENSILIDDDERNIEEWEKAGGIGILYRNAKEAVQKLDKILEKM